MTQVFKDIKIVELASILAGPLVGSFFAELGAEVIKIENKRQGGDTTRQWKSRGESDNGVGAYYASANTYKQVVFIDFLIPEDYKKVINLIKEADIVITNFQKKTAAKLDISIEKIKIINKDLIIAQLSAYDYDDPRPGFDMVMQAETGFISMSGTEEGVHTKMPVAMMDILAAHQMKEAILIAMIKREKEKKGSIIHVSLYKSGISALANQASNYLMEGLVPKPMGMLHPNISPYGDVVTTKDGQMLMLAIGSDKQFGKLANILNFEEIYLTKFKFNQQRLIHRKELNVVLKEVFSKHISSDIIEELNKGNVPFAKIKDLSEVFKEKYAKDMIVNQDIDGTEARSVSNISFKIN